MISALAARTVDSPPVQTVDNKHIQFTPLSRFWPLMTEKFSQAKEPNKLILSVHCSSARHYTVCCVIRFMDDVTLSRSLQSVEQDVITIMDTTLKTGLQLNTDKCEVIMDAALKTGLQLNTDQCEVIMDTALKTGLQLNTDKCEVIMDAALKTGLQLNTDKCEVIMEHFTVTPTALSR